ncbi:MAG: TolC family protein, partial [Gemmatimonadaceae bacterium]
APRSLSAIISLPLFDGFAREQRVEEAQVAREDARYNVRSRELALTADVTSAYLTLQTAQQTVALQQQNAAKAKQELKFVQDQYAVGLATFVDLTTSRTAFAQAEADRINAVYNYHKAVAALESAIGRPLR